MALNIERKKNIVSQIKKISKNSLSAIIADITYIKSNEINALRKIARIKNVRMFLVKNTLLKIALKNTQFECLKKVINGSNLIAYSIEYAGAAARLFIDFIKNNSVLKIKAGCFENKFILPENINYLSSQPTYQESIINIIKIIKEISIGKIIRLLNIIKEKK